ncbi:MAG: hypothetical protein ACFBSF_15620 [Leptolyngbyaceae cyanobacterium]
MSPFKDLRLYTSEDLGRLIERIEKSRAKENPGEVVRSQQDDSQPLDSIQAVRYGDTAMIFQNLRKEKEGQCLDRKVELER